MSTVAGTDLAGPIFTGVAVSGAVAAGSLLWHWANRFSHRDRYIGTTFLAALLLCVTYAARSVLIGSNLRSTDMVETWWIMYVGWTLFYGLFGWVVSKYFHYYHKVHRRASAICLGLQYAIQGLICSNASTSASAVVLTFSILFGLAAWFMPLVFSRRPLRNWYSMLVFLALTCVVILNTIAFAIGNEDFANINAQGTAIFRVVVDIVPGLCGFLLMAATAWAGVVELKKGLVAGKEVTLVYGEMTVKSNADMI